MNEQTMSRRESLADQVIDRAGRDPQFRSELLRNPTETVEQELGVGIPAGMEIRVVEETASLLYLVLPPEPVAVGRELTDRELELVAGGWSMDTVGGCEFGPGGKAVC
jgi:hypothetical protein